MVSELAVVSAQLDSFSALNNAVAATINAAGSADPSALLSAAAMALGPIGAGYLAAYAPAQGNNLAGTLLVGAVHEAIGSAVDASKKNFTTTDQP